MCGSQNFVSRQKCITTICCIAAFQASLDRIFRGPATDNSVIRYLTVLILEKKSQIKKAQSLVNF